MDHVSCWHLATSPHPHHRQCPPCPPLPSNGEISACMLYPTLYVPHLKRLAGMRLTVINFPAPSWKNSSIGLKNGVYCGKFSAINLLWLVNWTRAAWCKLTLSQMTTNWGCSGPSWTSVSWCVQKTKNEDCVVGTEDGVVMQCHCCLLPSLVLFLVLLLLLLSLFLFLPLHFQSWHKGAELTSGVFVVLWLRLIGLQLHFKCFHLCESGCFSNFSCVLYFKSMCFPSECMRFPFWTMCFMLKKKVCWRISNTVQSKYCVDRVGALFRAWSPQLEVVVLCA